MSKIQVNITTKVNPKEIRKEVHAGRDHWVCSSYTLPSGVVMNSGLYTAEQIDSHYHKLDGTLAPLGHPMVNGEFVSAFSPEGINLGHVGAFNRNVRKEGNRVYLEKWIDVEVASRSEKGRELLERVEAVANGEDVPPIHTSVAMFINKLEPSSLQKKQGIDFVAQIIDMDHDAILIDPETPGAATPEQGVGMMVNADQAVLLAPNAGVLNGESYRDKERRLESAAKDRFSDSEYLWIADFTDEQVIIVRDGGDSEMYGYRSEGGKILFDSQGAPVERKESWVTKFPVVNQLLQILGMDVKSQQQKPVTTNEEGAMPITPEEKADLVKSIGESVSGLLAPLQEQINTISANQAAMKADHDKLALDLTANSRAELETKRKEVAAVHGDIVANGATPEMLDVLHKNIGTAAPIVNGKTADGKEKFDEVVD